jgi:hypothetical protein
MKSGWVEGGLEVGTKVAQLPLALIIELPLYLQAMFQISYKNCWGIKAHSTAELHQNIRMNQNINVIITI